MRTPETKQARELLDALANTSGLIEPKLVVSETTQVAIPAQVLEHFMEVLHHLANGNVVIITPENALLTTGEAARILGCSRPHVVKLIKQGELNTTMVGSHYRVSMSDLKEYKSRAFERQREALRQLTAESQELFGDD